MSIRREINRLLKAQKPKPYEPPPPPPDRMEGMALWERGLDYLNRPAAASAGFAKAVLTGQGNPFKKWLSNFTGEESTSFSDVLAAAGMDRGVARATIGFALDVLADPTTYLTVGTGAGAKVAIGGVSKTLTKAGGAAHAALAAQKAARLQELIPKLAAKNPEALDRLLTVTGLTHLKGSWVSEAATHPVIAKEVGREIATRQVGRAIKGELAPARMEALMGKGIGPGDIVKPTAMRFMGAEIPGSAAALKATGAVAKGAYALGEKIPVAGPVLTAARVGAQKVGAGLKAVFSTKSGMPELDNIFRRKRSTMDFQTNQFMDSVEKSLIKPLQEIKAKLGPEEFAKALREVREFQEGILVDAVKQVPDEAKLAGMKLRVDRLTTKLNQISGPSIVQGAADPSNVGAIKQFFGAAPAAPTPVLPPKLLKKKARLEAELASAKAALAGPPPTKPVTFKERIRVEPSTPAAHAVAEVMREGYAKMHVAEGKALVNAPEAMRFYFPHYMRNEVRDLLTALVPSELRKLVKSEHAGMLGSAMRRTTFGNVDEITVEKLVQSGALDGNRVREYLKGKGINLAADDLLVFESDPVKAFIKRGLSSIRAMNAAEMAREVMESPGILKAKFRLSPESAEDIIRTLDQHPGHAAFLATKQFVEKFKTPLEKEAMKHGADKALQNTFIHEMPRTFLEHVLKNAKDHGGLEIFILPQEVAAHLSRAYSMQFDEKAIGEMLRLTDKLTGWWKAFATVWRPGFHIRNEISNLWQMFLGGVRSPEPAYKAFMAMWKPELVGNVGRYTAKEALDLADRWGMRKTGFVGSDIDDLVKRKMEPTINPFSTSGPLIRAGSALGTGFEDHAKVAMFFDQLMKGADPAAAAQHTQKHLFDYNDLTVYEKTFFRRLMPFYTFTRKSIPLALETVLTKPGYASALGKVRESAEKNVEDPIKDEYVASWIKEGMGIPIRTVGGKTEFFLLKGWIPLADLAKMDVTEAFGMLHPGVKAPIEYAMNRSVFTGRPIERFPGQKEKMMGVEMRSKTAHLLRNLVFMQEVDRLFFKAEVTAGTIPAALGFRTYAQDKVIQMRSRVYDLNNQVGDLKNVISLSTKRYGADSGITKQAEERLIHILAERDRVKADLLSIDPNALTTKKPAAGPPKPKQLPMTLQGFKRSVDIKRLLMAPQPTKPKVAGP
jgi:hypothetical protein